MHPFVLILLLLVFVLGYPFSSEILIILDDVCFGKGTFGVFPLFSPFFHFAKVEKEINGIKLLKIIF